MAWTRPPGPGEVTDPPPLSLCRWPRRRQSRRVRAATCEPRSRREQRGAGADKPGRQGARRTAGPSARAAVHGRFHCRRHRSRRRSSESVERPAQPSSEDIDQASEFMGKARAWSPVLWGGGAVYILHRRAGRGNREAGQARCKSSHPGRGGLEHTGLNANICARWGGGGKGAPQEAPWGPHSHLPRSPGRQKQVKARTRREAGQTEASGM